MKVLVRSLTVLAFGALAAIVPAKAGLPGEVIVEPKTGFQVWVPMSWRYGTFPDLPFTHLAMEAPDAAASGANCIAAAEEIAITKGATQAQLNESLKVPVGRDFWKTQAFQVFKKLEFESDGTRMHPSGIVIQEAIGGGEVEAGGKTFSRKMTATLWITPGMTYTLVCSTFSEKFEDYRPIVKEVAESFRTKDTASAISAAVNPAPGQTATPVSQMHGSAGFGGAQAEMGRSAVAGKSKIVPQK